MMYRRKKIKKEKGSKFLLKLDGKGCVRICPRNLAPFYLTNYIKWDKESKGRNPRL